MEINIERSAQRIEFMLDLLVLYYIWPIEHAYKISSLEAHDMKKSHFLPYLFDPGHEFDIIFTVFVFYWVHRTSLQNFKSEAHDMKKALF